VCYVRTVVTAEFDWLGFQMSSTPNKSVDRIFISFSFRGNKWDYDTTMFVCVCVW